MDAIDEDMQDWLREMKEDCIANGFDIDAFERQTEADEALVENTVYEEIVAMAVRLADIVKAQQGDWQNCRSHCWECRTLQGMELYLTQAQGTTLDAHGKTMMRHTLLECITKLVDILTSTTMDETDDPIVLAAAMTETGWAYKRGREVSDRLSEWRHADGSAVPMLGDV